MKTPKETKDTVVWRAHQHASFPCLICTNNFQMRETVNGNCYEGRKVQYIRNTINLGVHQPEIIKACVTKYIHISKRNMHLQLFVVYRYDRQNIAVPAQVQK